MWLTPIVDRIAARLRDDGASCRPTRPARAKRTYHLPMPAGCSPSARVMAVLLWPDATAKMTRPRCAKSYSVLANGTQHSRVMDLRSSSSRLPRRFVSLYAPDYQTHRYSVKAKVLAYTVFGRRKVSKGPTKHDINLAPTFQESVRNGQKIGLRRWAESELGNEHQFFELQRGSDDFFARRGSGSSDRCGPPS